MTPVRLDIYVFTSVPKLLAAWFATQPDGQRDITARRIAARLRCSRAFVWNMVSGAQKAHPDQVSGLARELGLDEDEREYLRRLVVMQNADAETLKEAGLAMWELHAAKTGIPSAELALLLQRESVAGAREGALAPIVALLDQIGGCPAPRELAALLLAPPSPVEIAGAVALVADGFLMGQTLSPRLLALEGLGLPGDAPTAAWFGLLDLARESLLRVPPDDRDYHAITWSSDGRAAADDLRAWRRLGRDLAAIVRANAEAKVDRCHMVLIQQLRLTEVMGREGPKKRPAIETVPAPLQQPSLSSKSEEGSTEKVDLTGDTACLFLHLDLASYARTWIAARQRRDDPCSAAYLARRMGVSRTLANDLTTGAARFRPEHVAGAARAFGWTEDEQVYGDGLARYAQATDPEERTLQRNALHAYAAARGIRTTEGESFRASSSWARPAITALSFLPSFRTNPAWISLALRGRIRWQDALELTNNLLAMGILESRPVGALRPSVHMAPNPPNRTGLARYALHDSTLRLAQGELYFPTSDQHFGGWVLALPDAAVPVFRQRMDVFKAERLAYYQAADARAALGDGALDRVILASLQLFPVTLPLATSISSRTRVR